MYFCCVKYKPKMVMSTVLFHIIVTAKRTIYAFGLYFCVLILFTLVLKHLILLAKQVFVCKTLVITPPSTAKQCSLGVGGNYFLLRVFPQNEFIINPKKTAYLSVSMKVSVCTYVLKVANVY